MNTEQTSKHTHKQTNNTMQDKVWVCLSTLSLSGSLITHD